MDNRTIDINQQLLDFASKPVQNSDGLVLTLKYVCMISLLAQNELLPEQKLARYDLANRFYKTTSTIETNLEDRNLLRECICNTFSTVVFGYACTLLDPPSD